ncbi:AI-2E family transporter [Adhaeribacter radiodurans]|uniref:AI-2E family transporter n=1 Tax=Adhaeribacter radiodurans TaxID=2745197 RepID=A0A7L7LA87_9BACT|nr:AI-2E family transporter [Adhaeribacter radiodurans]QMU29319.1 AI-2E family transporter [Adhaeribacter radiodurans]
MRGISINQVAVVQLVVILTSIILYYGRIFLIPLAFAIFFAMMLLPVSRKLEKWGIKRIPATLLCIVVVLLFMAGIVFVVAAQASSISQDWPQIQKKLQQMVDTGQQYIQQQFGVAPHEQIEFVKSQISKFSQSFNKFSTGLVSGSLGMLSGFALTLIYFFFLMWKREKYEEFFLKLTNRENQPAAKQKLRAITKVASGYLVARLLSMLFLAIFYAVGFSIIGLKNALLISLVAVLPTIVPYIGSFVGGVFPLMMALVSGSSGMILPIVIILIIAQVIDNNIIEPLVEGNSLNLSPIITIVAIVLGELVWGIAGMILFIPLFAILRIVCDHIPALQPYGFLLRNDVKEPEWVEKVKGWFNKK